VHLKFAAPTLEGLDSLACDALALPLHSDERPPRGATALVDWRLCGLLSRALALGEVTGKRGECVLIPGRPKLAVDKIFVHGLGPSSELDAEGLREGVQAMLDSLVKAQAHVAALVLPGRAAQQVDAVAAIDALVAARVDVLDEIIVVEAAPAQREMEPVLERERRRAHAGLRG
jgi:leucyl aminopeptidase